MEKSRVQQDAGMKEVKQKFAGLQPFELKVTYGTIDADSPENVFESHVHPQCEIYVNVSGDVSFVVENHIYPILPGNIIITRPYEYHHCVYNSKEPHTHFCLFISCEGNESLFDLFFKRRAGENNMLALPDAETQRLYSLCSSLMEENVNELDKYCRFLELLGLLGQAQNVEVSEKNYPADIRLALNYINNCFSQDFSLKELAQKSNVSLNTLERHFAEYLKTTPGIYVRNKRLASAARLLAQGANVTEACTCSGFSDCSGFIMQFKKMYGKTPLQYKKKYLLSDEKMV